MINDEDLLVALLNSAPVIKRQKTEGLSAADGIEFARRFGGTGTHAEVRHLQRVRLALHKMIRGQSGADRDLSSLIGRAVLRPEVTPEGILWELHTPPHERVGVRAAVAWAKVTEQMPGRLRACANSECNLFLLDHSRPGTAKWCSMSICGNRNKARNHAGRHREE